MIRFGLERIFQLVELPLPWRAFHVAGTNGKGSVCSYITALLRRGNLRVGQFTSPHILDRRDCITVNQRIIGERRFHDAEKYVGTINKDRNVDASEFELLTATAFEIFNREKVDVGVIECGMGGREDATNVLENPLASVVTRISEDHREFLGPTLKDIAWHKAGIRKPDQHFIISGSNSESVLKVCREESRNMEPPPYITPGIDNVDDRELESFFMTLNLDYRKFPRSTLENMYLALSAVHLAMRQLTGMAKSDALMDFAEKTVPSSQRMEFGPGLATQNGPQATTSDDIPREKEWMLASRHIKNLAPALIEQSRSVTARLHQVSVERVTQRKSFILVDGAHNIGAWHNLRDYVSKFYNKVGSRVVWILGITSSRREERATMIKTLTRRGDVVFAVEFGPVESMPWVASMDPQHLVSACSGSATDRDFDVEAFNCRRDSLDALRKATDLANEGPIIVSGSLYLCADVLRLLRRELRPTDAIY